MPPNANAQRCSIIGTTDNQLAVRAAVLQHAVATAGSGRAALHPALLAASSAPSHNPGDVLTDRSSGLVLPRRPVLGKRASTMPQVGFAMPEAAKGRRHSVYAPSGDPGAGLDPMQEMEGSEPWQSPRPSDAEGVDMERRVPDHDAEASGVVFHALRQTALFKGCGSEFLLEILAGGKREVLGIDQKLIVQDQHKSMIVLESGALRLCVGPGPAVVVGPGAIVNICGLVDVKQDMLTMYSKPTESERDPGEDPYEVYGAPTGSMGFEVYDARLPDKDMMFGGGLSGDQLCYYSLCPSACKSRNSRASLKHLVGGQLPFVVSGARAGEAPMTRCDRADYMKGGAAIVLIDWPLVQSVGLLHPKDMATVQKNWDELQFNWKQVLSRCRTLFTAAPPEFLWGLAEILEVITVNATDLIVQEGERGPNAESLIIIDQGDAEVEKQVGISSHEAKYVPIGSLKPSAIIGDWCLISSGLPRPASVRARTDVKLLILKAENLRNLVRMFPGVLAGSEQKLNKVAAFFRTRLTGQAQESLLLCNLFAGCSSQFLIDLTNAVEYKVFFCGQSISAEADDSDDESSISDNDAEEALDVKGKLFAFEFGQGSFQAPGRGQLGKLRAGELLQSSALQKCDFCVSTPLLLAMKLKMKALQEVLKKHPTERHRYTPAFLGETSNVMRGVVKQIEVFKMCGNGFVDDLSLEIEHASYMPGQTIVVMGAQDNSQMFLLRRGQVSVEIEFKKVADMKSGATFGELVMLGVVQSRTATVRAMTYCTMIQIPRVPFWDAIERFPEERGQFEQLALNNMKISASWPVLEGVASRLGLLLNLQAPRRTCLSGDQFFNSDKGRESAVLVLAGMCAVLDAEGQELEVLKPGECFNEQILLGIPNFKAYYIVPKEPSELQIINPDMWEKVTAEFTNEKNQIRRNIHQYMARTATKRLDGNNVSILRQTALFRTAPQEMVDQLHQRLQPKVFKTGEAIVVGGQEGDAMYIVLEVWLSSGSLLGTTA
ncbi:unnamed protein product [Polarella glacialis]|uniref:Cyclic nucleotide-binding domain-containing protein n=1 Tax=Polarella glacialis TaxID=89957 RepID=A0A813IM84_POLGL|nr:unnamed protein product [Polarella glacialis]